MVEKKETSSSRLGMGQGAKPVPVFFLVQTENVSKTPRGTCRNAGSVLMKTQKGEIRKDMTAISKYVGC